jgi:hypothetical protein
MAIGETHLKAEEHEALADILGLHFRELASLHTRFTTECVAAYRAAEKSLEVAEAAGFHQDAVRLGKIADVVKAVMRLRFPEGADVWFNE